jgi:cyclophilin family peptidyl-prolyl cis-trans isomerase/HEAT repeat protein
MSRFARRSLRLALLLAALVLTGAPPAAAISAALRAIAIAEDRREWNDGVLSGQLASSDAAIRARAALAVGRLQDSTTTGALIPLLQDADAAVRREAVFALGQIGHVSAREALEQSLEDPDREVAQHAIEALGKVADPRSTAAVMEFLRHADPTLRGTSAVALWRLADSTAVGRLMERHEDPDPGVRWRVLYALEKVQAPDRIVLIAALHQDEDDARVRAYAARTLGRQKSERATTYLLQMLGDGVSSVAVQALRGLQFGADSTCGFCAPSVARLLDHKDPYVRLTAAQVLSAGTLLAGADSAGRAEVLDSLRARLADPDGATRAAAAAALLAHEGEAAWVDAGPLLDDPSFYVRASMVGALANLPGERFEEMLMERLSWRTPMFERMNAAIALGGRGNRAIAPLLRPELYDRGLLFVAAIAGALEQLSDTLAVPSLTRAYQAHVDDADPDARISLRDALRTLAGRVYADSVEALHARTPAAADYPADYGTPPAAKRAVLRTSRGVIEWAFYPDEAPQTVANFVRLAREGYFDGMLVHRVVPDFVIQDGDPTATGWGGPGWSIRCEYNRLRYDEGMVGMALSGKDTGGSQWFITHSPQPHLNGRYTIFARVTKGLEVVHRIIQGDRIEKVEIIE